MPDQGEEWPKSLDEWKEYVESIPASDLTDKAYAVNGMRFVELLQEDGYEPDEIEEIFYMFARRLHREETTYVPPRGSDFYISYQRLLRERGDIDEPE